MAQVMNGMFPREEEHIPVGMPVLDGYPPLGTNMIQEEYKYD